jgi:hypothetical protein
MMRRTILLLPVLGAFACSSNGAECYVGADCASGACSAAGQCVAAPALDAAAAPDGAVTLPDGAVVQPAPDGSSVVPESSVGPGDDAAATCVPNNDGTITRSEVPMGAGLRATYLVADSVTWDTTGTIGDAGTRTWDLTGSLSGDHSVIFTALTPAGTWWASNYSAATFAMQLEASQTLLGVRRTPLP